MSTITRPTGSAPIHRPRTASVRRLMVTVVLAAVVGGTAVLAHLGCTQMREVAPLDSTDAYGRTVIGYSWSIRPTGFTVRYDDGSSTTHLWW